MTIQLGLDSLATAGFLALLIFCLGFVTEYLIHHRHH